MDESKYISEITGGHDAEPPEVVTGLLKAPGGKMIRYVQTLWLGPNERLAKQAEMTSGEPITVEVLGYPTTARAVSFERVNDGLRITLDVDADPLPESVQRELRDLEHLA